MSKPQDDRPRRNGLPLYSRKRWDELKAGLVPPRVRPARERKPRTPIKTKPKGRTVAVADYLARNPTCELTRSLDAFDPPGWAEHKEAWAGHPEAKELDPHHVHQRQFGDADWNLIACSRVTHEYVEGNCRPQEGGVTRIGRAVAMLVKDGKGELSPAVVQLVTGRNPIGLVTNDLENGVFDSCPSLRRAVALLVERYGF